MERTTSKLRRVFVITLLSATTMVTAGSLTLKAQIPIPPMSHCIAWESAYTRHSPEVSNLAPLCHVQLEARGVGIRGLYPWAEQLRSQLPDDSARRGFDIGMAAAEGQTLPGPKKDALQAALKPEERYGYGIAVNKSLMWNKYEVKDRNNELAVKGAALTAADPQATILLNQQPDGPPRRGFNIGMAAADGQTLPGPIKQSIRGSLAAEEQGGFDFAVSYTLIRNQIQPHVQPEPPRAPDLTSENASSADYRRPERPVRGSDRRNLTTTLRHLRQGREFLEAAKPDQGGHHAKAIDYTNKAIEELLKVLDEID